MRLLLSLTCSIVFSFLFAWPGLMYAVSNTFPIRTFVGDDTEPPTVPVFQSVVPVSPLQINVAWSPAVDNVYLSGYRLFRDGVQIATTSLITFNDTGLAPETLYEYTVDAFDSYGNISSTSAAVATTTLALPIIVPPATTTPSSTRPTTGTLVTGLERFLIQPAVRSAFFTWQTNTNTRYTLQWGRTTAYEIGTVSTNIYNQAHETTIETLEPGTTYWYMLTSINGRGVSQVSKQGSFTTLPAVQTTLPPNVRNVVATVSGTDVMLRWQNPVLPAGAQIRVVRSHLFYPLSPTDGALVYEGVGTSVQDRAPLATHSPVYYTIFVMGETGLVSSGAVVVATTKSVPAVSTSTASVPVVPTAPVAPSESGEDTVLRAAAVTVRQGVRTQTFDSAVILDSDTEYSIYIPVDAVTTNLKSIIATIQDPTDQRQSTSYLLKLNQDGDAYVAVIQSPYVSGASRAIIEVFDFNQATVRRIITPLTFVAPESAAVMFPDGVVRYGQMILPLMVLGGFTIGLFVLLWFVYRRREDKH